jgi:hypothetical protein
MVKLRGFLLKFDLAIATLAGATALACNFQCRHRYYGVFLKSSRLVVEFDIVFRYCSMLV